MADRAAVVVLVVSAVIFGLLLYFSPFLMGLR